MSDTNAEPGNTFLLLCSILGFAAVSWLLWKFLLSPPAPTGASSSAATAAGATGSSSTRATAGGATPSSTVAARTRRAPSSTPASKKDAEDDLFSFGRPRHPPHVVAPANWEQNETDLSGCLVQGVVPFRSTPASGYESRLKKEATSHETDGGDEKPPADLIVVNRRERARIFARMFSAAGGGRPPNRGANIVVTIQHTETSCSKLQKALFLLGTYYNLFLLIDGAGVAAASGNDAEVKEFVTKMRSELLNQDDSDSKGYTLNAEIVPPHRIAFSSTSKGRVAFVRQLHGAELVVDFDENVTKELERFGFRVLVYPKISEASSALGKFLIP